MEFCPKEDIVTVATPISNYCHCFCQAVFSVSLSADKQIWWISLLTILLNERSFALRNEVSVWG